MRVILQSALPRHLALFSLVFTYSVSLNLITTRNVTSCFPLIFMLLGFILLVLPYNPKDDAMAYIWVTWSLFFQQLVFSGLRVWLWHVLRITVKWSFFTWVNKVYHGPGWPTCPCLQVLLCVFGCIAEAKVTIIVNKKIDENQMGEYERPAIQKWIKRVEGSNSKK